MTLTSAVEIFFDASPLEFLLDAAPIAFCDSEGCAVTVITFPITELAILRIPLILSISAILRIPLIVSISGELTFLVCVGATGDSTSAVISLENVAVSLVAVYIRVSYFPVSTTRSGNSRHPPGLASPCGFKMRASFVDFEVEIEFK